MLKESNQIKFGFSAFLILLSIFCVNTNAQTTRSTNTSKPAATPTPNREVPEIISRADDVPNSDQIIVQPIEFPQNPRGQTDDNLENRIKQLNERVNTLESTKENQYDQKQKRLLLNLDILSRAEQRADALRKQLFDLIERENEIQTKLDQLSNNLRPEAIERSVSLAGSLRPEELREQRKRSLEIEKTNLTNLLTEVVNNKTNLQQNVQRAATLVDKLRLKLEKDIDDALADDKDN